MSPSQETDKLNVHRPLPVSVSVVSTFLHVASRGTLPHFGREESWDFGCAPLRPPQVCDPVITDATPSSCFVRGSLDNKWNLKHDLEITKRTQLPTKA